MPTLKALIAGLQQDKGLEIVSSKRLYEAFLELDRRITGVEVSTGAAGRPYSRATSSGALTILTATPTPLALDLTIYQNDPLIHNDAVGNTKFTAQIDGFYFVKGNVQWPPNAIGTRTIQIMANGTTIIASETDLGNVTYDWDQFVAAGVFLFAGEYIEIVVTQISGGNLVIPVVAEYSPIGVFAQF